MSKEINIFIIRNQLVSFLLIVSHIKQNIWVLYNFKDWS